MCIQSLRKHPMLKQLILYSMSYLVLGALLFGFGPLIPYYAQRDHQSQQTYSTVLLARMIGALLGAFAVKLIEKKLTIHQGLGVGLLIAGAFSIGFNYVTNLYGMAVMLGFSSFGVAIVDIFCNIGTIEASKTGGTEKWLQFLHACMGIGGLIVPVIIYSINYYTYLALGVLCIVFIPLVLILKSPQIFNSQTEIPLNEEDKNEKKKPNFISLATIMFMGLSMLLIVGIQATFGSWISTYVVKKQITSKEGAALYNSLYWISITAFRFMFIFVGGKPSIKIGLLTFLGFISSLLSLLFIQKIDAHIGVIISTIVIGFCDSAIFALILALSSELCVSLQPNQTSTLLLFANFGEGTLAVVVGLLFNVLPYETLYVSISVFFLLVFLNNFNVNWMLARDKSKVRSDESEPLNISTQKTVQQS